ncbi:uncharacterized protein LOC131657698 [Vicia villosa]|uniref:uncharacterized protein LOC131657698 n=1 Tax=Vicia villosa TaxID=3911 RepID=UPI00273ABA38|nr:uncharacterized protein LOC131657698 [Vicia villosa]
MEHGCDIRFTNNNLRIRQQASIRTLIEKQTMEHGCDIRFTNNNLRIRQQASIRTLIEAIIGLDRFLSCAFSDRFCLNGKIEGNNVGILKDGNVEIGDETEKLRTYNGPVKDKKVKQPSGKGVNAGLVRKNKVGKDEEVAATVAVSNGTLSLDSNLRQAVKSRLLNDKHTRLNKQAGKSDAVSSEAPIFSHSIECYKQRLLAVIALNATSNGRLGYLNSGLPHRQR